MFKQHVFKLKSQQKSQAILGLWWANACKLIENIHRTSFHGSWNSPEITRRHSQRAHTLMDKTYFYILLHLTNRDAEFIQLGEIINLINGLSDYDFC